MPCWFRDFHSQYFLFSTELAVYEETEQIVTSLLFCFMFYFIGGGFIGYFTENGYVNVDLFAHLENFEEMCSK